MPHASRNSSCSVVVKSIGAQQPGSEGTLTPLLPHAGPGISLSYLVSFLWGAFGRRENE